MKTKLAWRVALTVAAIVVVLVPLLGVIGYRAIAVITRQGITAAQTDAAAAAMATVQRLLATASQDIQLIAEDRLLETRLEEPAGSDHLSQEKAFDDMLRLTGPWDQVLIVDPAGKVVISTSGRHSGESILGDAGARAVFLRARAGLLAHSDVYRSSDMQRPALVIAAPIRSEHGGRTRILGVAMGWFSLSAINHRLDEVQQAIDPRIVDASGVTIATRSNSTSEILNLHVDPAAAVPGVVRTSQTQRGTSGYESNGWRTVFDEPEESVYAPVRYVGRLLLMLFAALVASLVAVGFFLARYFVRPVEVLIAAAARVAAGDLDSRIEIRTGDEMERLGEAFNEMTARLKVQIEERKRSEERFRLAMRATRDVVFEWDLQSNVWVNEAWEVRFGYPASGDIGYPAWSNATHPDERERIDAGLNAAIASGEEFWNCEYRKQRAAGTYADVETRVYIARDQEGRPLRVGGVMTEITERKHAEAALRKSEERFALATRATSDVIFEWDLRTNACWVNETWQTRYGRPAWGDIDSSSWSDGLHPDESDAVLRSIQAAISSGQEFWGLEYKFRRGDGSYADVFTRAYIARDAGGQPLRMVGAMMDVSERKRAEDELRSMQVFLKSTIDAIPEVVAVKSVKDFRYVMANRAGLRLTESITGKTDFEIFPRAIAELMQDEDKQIVETGIATNGVKRNYPYAGRDLWFETSRVPLFDARGNVEFILVVGEDITEQLARDELLRQKEAAESANAAKSEFLARMSHEIRTPMNGVLGMSSLLSDTNLSADQREYADTIHSSANALLAVINDILDLSRIESGKVVIERAPFSLRKTISDSAKVVAITAAQKSVELVVDIDPDVPDALIGDGSRLRQMILNLAGNAVKFTEHGEIVITAVVESSDGDATLLRFSVSDTGAGIPPEQIERVFGAFEQVDSSDTRSHGGTGLGLAITRRLADLMGGRIWAASEPGKGSTFTFTAKFRRQSVAMPTRDELQGRRVFLVDDNPAVRAATARMLTAHGAQVSSFASCDEAESQCTAAPFPFDDLIIDSLLAECGVPMIERALSQGVRADQIVMLLSAAQLQDGARQIARFGVSRSLVKPIVEDRLIQVMLHAKSAEKSTKSGGESARRSLRVLVAEDNLVNQRVATRFLERDGHTTVVASNGREAVDQFQRHSFDVILMDVQMPEMDGLEATREIRRLERALGLHTPIIALTAHSVQGDRERCIEAGMDGYVSKPIKAAELASALATVIPNVHGAAA